MNEAYSVEHVICGPKEKREIFIICGLREREREREKKKKDFDQDFDQCHLSVLVRRVYVITTRSF